MTSNRGWIEAQYLNPDDNIITINETMMSVAYALSKRSQCLKRSVGAVISDGLGTVLSSGFNDVVTGQRACVARQGDTWCNRDTRLEEVGKHLQRCPKCGGQLFSCGCLDDEK